MACKIYKNQHEINHKNGSVWGNGLLIRSAGIIIFFLILSIIISVIWIQPMAEHQQWIYPGTIPLPFWDFYFKELYSSIASVMLIPAFLSALIMAIFLFILTDEAYKSEGSDDDQKYLSTGSQYSYGA